MPAQRLPHASLLGAPGRRSVPAPTKRANVADHDIAPVLTQLSVNDERHAVACRPDATLLDTLREDLGLTGTKAVCEMGDCGACTVLLDDRAVYSCLVLTAECGDRRIDTIEGVSTGQDLDPIQVAFVDHDAFQCGFCTPGQIMSLVALRRRSETPSRADIEAALAGNLCRCGAYRHILDAAGSALGVDVAVEVRR